MAPAEVSPQVCALPALTAAKVLLPEGTAVRPFAPLPQHEIAPALFTAQVCTSPALTALNVPVWPAVWPWEFDPQQLSAQLCELPIAIAVNAPAGGVVRPLPALPQQEIVPAPLSEQL